jgi:CBS domain-containing membrane protein
MRAFGASALAAAVAIAATLAGMIVLRCVHPPGGSVALLPMTTFASGGATRPGFDWVLVPVLLDAAMLVLVAAASRVLLCPVGASAHKSTVD